MTLIEQIARVDSSVRNVATHLPASLYARVYSHGRAFFFKKMMADAFPAVEVDSTLARTLWGIRFRSPLFNSAGMFKNGDGYELCTKQGAGAYLAGTTTAVARIGNIKRGITHPFSPFPHSKSAVNWMGLPNRGHSAVAHTLSKIEKVQGVPIGASVSSDPTQSGVEALQGVVQGMKEYRSADVDFIELNESCPNVPHHAHQSGASALDSELVARLDYIHKHFIKSQERFVPVVVKFSNDTSLEDVPNLVQALLERGFSGINFGNTSTQYTQHKANIHASDARIFEFFTHTFGGGLSGAILKQSSLELSQAAVRAIPQEKKNEFLVVRTGGIENANDVATSLTQGVSLCQWYTGYFELFSEQGHSVYNSIYKQLLSL